MICNPFLIQLAVVQYWADAWDTALEQQLQFFAKNAADLRSARIQQRYEQDADFPKVLRLK